MALPGGPEDLQHGRQDGLPAPAYPAHDGRDQVASRCTPATCPSTGDTCGITWGNMDVLKSGGERLSKISSRRLRRPTSWVAPATSPSAWRWASPSRGTRSCWTRPTRSLRTAAKQYYYKVDYRLPAVVQAVKGARCWTPGELDPAMQPQFGNEQVETQSRTAEGSTTTIRVVSFNSQEALDKAYGLQGGYWLARKAALVQLGRMIESVYPRLLFS